tara:strand:+ start:4658 stop:5062 length:405 start_codon:yes stop_codon:yes gene_type:complete
MSSQKTKGDNYERELAKWMNENIYGDNRAERAPLSGGGSHHMGAGGADLLGTPGIFVEAKRVEKLPWRDALAQAERNAAYKHTHQTPLVITRRNRETTEDSVCFLRLKEFKKYYEAYLRERLQLDAKDDTPNNK